LSDAAFGLAAKDPNPAVDCEDVNDLREYIGISWFGDDVVAAFTGSIPYDPNDPPPTNPGVIWSSWFHW